MGYYTNMLLDKVKLKTTNGTDQNDKPIIIAEDEIDCKIEIKNSTSVNTQGIEETTSGRLFTESIVKSNDIIEFNNQTYTVTNVTPYYPIGDKTLVINEVHFN